MSDIFGLSGAAKEIVNAVTAGVGTLYQPRRIRAEAEDQAYARLIETDAAAQSDLILRATTGDDLARRALERLRTKLLSQEENLDRIFERAIAIADALTDSNRRDNKIDPDWMTQFINHAQDISQDELRNIWAKILAKEASSEGAVSIQTIDILRTMTRVDALAFQELLKIKSAFGGEFYPIDEDCMIRNGLHVDEIHRLARLGLLETPKVEWNNVGNNLQQCYPELVCTLLSISPHTEKIAGHVVSIYGDDGVAMYAYRLTSAGVEIENSLGQVEDESVKKDDLFESFKNVIKIRLGYKFKCDDEIDENERKMASNAGHRILVSGRIPYSEWRKTNR